MKVLVLGGTSFIGRAVAEHLLRRGDQVALFHRGRAEPPGLDAATHIHGDRLDLPAHRRALERFGPDAVLDSYALTRRDAELACDVLPGVPAVVLSSQDVYAAYEGLLSGRAVADVPLAESAPLRRTRRVYGQDPPPGVPADYEKLDVEDVWARRNATVLRLPMVYGPHDPQCREGFVLRRLAAGRHRIPVGAGNLLWSRAHVADVAAAVVRALGEPRAWGRCFNLAEPTTPTIGRWIEQIAAAAAAELELVRAPDALLPPDLFLTAAHPQHLLADVHAAQDVLGWHPRPPDRGVADSVHWHLEHRTHAPWTEEDTARDEAALRAGEE